MRRSREDVVFDITVYIILAVITLIVLYPLYFVLIASFSDPDLVNSGSILFWPQGLNIDG